MSAPSYPPKSEYSKLLLDPRWQKKRIEILQRDDFTCQLCGDSESTLHVHHCFYRKNNLPWDYPNSSLITLCYDCHDYETVELYRCKQALLEALSIKGATAGDYNCLACAIYESTEYRFNEQFISALCWAIKNPLGRDYLMDGFMEHCRIESEKRRAENAKS